jgi:hypothetical protein
MKKLTIAAATAVGMLFFATPVLAADYTVYCTGKIEIDTRTLAQMKSARGKAKVLKVFSNLTDAQKFAKQQGGVGATCQM